MKRIISAKIKKDHYKADACILWCFDDRFSPLLQQLIAAKNFKHVDLIKVAGGARDLASQTYLLEQIEKSIKLHQTPRVVLMVHADCGAYGKKFESLADEQKFYAEELRKAGEAVEKFLRKSNRKIKIERYFADFQGLRGG